MSADRKQQPRTGDGRTGGQKPQAKDCKMRTSKGYATSSQPGNWVAKVVDIFKKDK